MSERLKLLGKRKIAKAKDPSKPKDALNSHRFKGFRPASRKNPNMVPDVHASSPSSASKSFTGFIKNMNSSNTKVDMAKAAKSGVWKITKMQVIDIARKYKFNVPNKEQPSKHLGSTGIQMVRYKPGVYYLYKPRKMRKTKVVG